MLRDLAILVPAMALGAFYWTRMLRKLLPEKLTEIKPFSCNLCMSWWGSLTVPTILFFAYQVWLPALLAVLPSAGLSLLLLEWAETLAPKEGPPLGP